jgi:hypothetical protein
MKNLIKILIFLGKIAEDFLILSGLIFIISATFMLNKIAGIYVLGFILLFIGLLIARKGGKRVI